MSIRYYKKLSLAISMMARDFLVLPIGEQAPTILEYAEKFEVSRGVIQDALSQLQEERCIDLLKRGVKGSILLAKNTQKLFEHTDWKVITGTMPTPVNPYLRSLATAIFVTMKENEIPFSFSYIMGGERRSSMLDKGAYEFSLVSENTALHFVEQYPNLEVAIRLAPCIYSMEYAVFVNRPHATGIEDGMIVGVDSACYDQTLLSQQCVGNHQVTYLESSAVSLPDLFNQKKIDALVTRNGPWYIPNESTTVVPIKESIPDKYPVIICRKDNYGLKKLLHFVLNTAELFNIQRSVLADPMKEKFG